MKKRLQPRGRSVRWLLLSVNALVLLIPVLAFLGLRVYQRQLIRQTETKLIAEAVVIGEAWRARLHEEMGTPPADVRAVRPPDAADPRFFPWEPRLDAGPEILPQVVEPTVFASDRDGPTWRAGARIAPLLERATAFNLTAAHVVDAGGFVVAATRAWHGANIAHVPEVSEALAGRYGAALRDRRSDEPPPPLSSISRRGSMRVYVAIPIFADGEVVGAVRMSRTSMAPLKAAWLTRGSLLAALVLSVVLTVAVSLYLSRTFTRPLQRLTDAAQAVAGGDQRASLAAVGRAPAEIHTLSEALASMRAQLAERADYVAEFAANVSHELKTPITSIRGAAELLRDEGAEMPADQRDKFAGNIVAAATRMQRLVARLLELARIESAPESADPIDVRPFLERIAESYDDRLRLDTAAAPATITMNPDHLELALRNLLDNALRHGGESPVDLVVRGEGDRLLLEVRDRGPGISDANRARIFRRFFTTERDRGGTGLGLAIVQAVARTRGGEVTFETGPKGTTFSLRV